jgi:hypothetical protein
MKKLAVHDWDEHQTYRKDRGQPPWIKVHRHIMRNIKWVSLDDAERGQLVAMWLLAADHDGAIPASPEIIQKLCFMSSRPNLQKFIDLGFLDGEWRQPDAKPTPSRRQSDEPKAETETETETEEEKPIGPSCDDPSEKKKPKQPKAKPYTPEFEQAWADYPKRLGGNPKKDAWHAWNARTKEGVSPQTMIDGVSRYAEFIRETGKQGTEYVMQTVKFFGVNELFADDWAVTVADTAPLVIPEGNDMPARSALWKLCQECGITADEVRNQTPDYIRDLIRARHPRAVQRPKLRAIDGGRAA